MTCGLLKRGPWASRETLQTMTIDGFTLTAAVALLPDALAYIDPGTGSYLLMWLLGGILAGLYTLKMYWRKVKASVAGLFGRKPADGGDQP